MIYQSWSTFLKIITTPTNKIQAHFAKCQKELGKTHRELSVYCNLGLQLLKVLLVFGTLAKVRRGGTPHRSYGSIVKINKYYYYILVRYWFTLESTNDHAHNHKHRNDRLTDKVDPKE
jgi:hypothetical protein